MAIYRTSLGSKLRNMRKARNLTLSNVSETTGLSLSFLSDIERGRTLPSLKTLARIAEALDVTVIAALEGVDTSEWLR